MVNYKAEIAEHIQQQLAGIELETILGMLEYPPNTEMGDLSLPCFKLSKTLRKSPQAIADEIKDKIGVHPALEKVESVSGYLNFYLDKQKFAEDMIQAILHTSEPFGKQNLGQGQTIVIDFSSPNIAKPFHIGHLRSTVIGGALRNIFAYLGYQVVGINHLGDWGTQFGKLIVAFKNWGSAEQIETDGIAELLRLYVLFHEEAEKNPNLEDEARGWFVRLEQGDEEALRLWKWFVDISLKEFHKIYDLLGARFDSYAGESFYNDKMAPVVAELKAKGLLVEDDGALIVKLDDYNMPPAIMVKKDGASLYHTRDVSAALYRKRHYDFAKCIYVTDYAQNLHFQQWFKIIDLMGYDWSKDLVHIAFGRVSLEGAGLSTRKGNVVKLEELLTKAIDKTLEIIESKNPKMENKNEVARQVGVGAIIFSDLSANRIKDINFSWEEALNFDGETGPYVQYTHARACSVLRKANDGDTALSFAISEVDAGLLDNAEAQQVLKQLYLFPEKIVQAMDKLEPSIVSRHLVDLSQSFNHFYHECPILVEDTALKQARLTLVKCAQLTLKHGLHLIGLETPEKI